MLEWAHWKEHERSASIFEYRQKDFQQARVWSEWVEKLPSQGCCSQISAEDTRVARKLSSVSKHERILFFLSRNSPSQEAIYDSVRQNSHASKLSNLYQDVMFSDMCDICLSKVDTPITPCKCSNRFCISCLKTYTDDRKERYGDGPFYPCPTQCPEEFEWPRALDNLWQENTFICQTLLFISSISFLLIFSDFSVAIFYSYFSGVSIRSLSILF